MGCLQSKSIEYPEPSVHGIPYAIECKVTRISKHIVLWNQYLVIRFLGSGASGQVYLCMDIHTHDLVAVKCIPTRDGARVPMEAQHLQTLKSAANIVPFQGILYDVTSSQTMIVMEYYGGGYVFDRNQMNLRHPVPEDVARWYIRDIARGVMALHARGIIHGDLKLENALVSCKGSIGLIDLGSSKEYTDRADGVITSRRGGTPLFQAPEILLEKGPYNGKAADVYALGTCLYTLLFSKTPYEAECISDLLCLVRQDGVTIPDHPQVSSKALALIRGLLDHDPQKRMTLKELSTHEWITDNGRLGNVCIDDKRVTMNEQEGTLQDIVCPKETKEQNSGTLYAQGERICMQGEYSDGRVGIIVEGSCDIVCRGTVPDDTASFSQDLHSSDADWTHITSHGSSTSSSSAYDAQHDERMKKKEVRNLEMEIDNALERLEQLRCRSSTMRGFQEEYTVERNARILGEAVFQPSILPATSHAYSAIATSLETRVLWISPEALYESMSSNAALHQTMSLIRCRRRSMMDTISGLCLIRDMIM